MSRFCVYTAYTNGQVSSITRGGYYGNSTKQNQTYTFTRDDYGRVTETAVGGVTLSTNTYDDRGRLESATYGNGDGVIYTYDNLDRMKKTLYNDTLDEIEYHYDNFDDFFSVPLAEVAANMKPRVIATSVNNIFEEYIATHPVLDARVEGRITIVE